MCDHPNREAAMTVLAYNESGTATVWCDPCLAPLVKALNDGGLSTVASCCGHGRFLGRVALADGRELLILPDFETAEAVVDALLAEPMCDAESAVGGVEEDADTLRAVVFRMAEDITRIKRVCTQEHPPKMGSPNRDWPAGTETRHSDGSLCVLLNDGDHARVLPPAETEEAA